MTRMMTTTTTFLLLSALALAVTACEGGSTNTAKAEDGYATGVALDTRGNPVAGAKILLDNSVFYASYIHGSTSEDGTYRIRVQPGAWRAHATLQKQYNGHAYTFQLHPDAIDSFDQDGAVRNFRWQLEGRRPENDHGYYGGFIQLTADVGFDGDLAHAELVLTPEGPLVDGSDGKQLRLRLGDHYWRQYYHIEDIPVGRYTVTASLDDEQGPRPLRIQDWHARGDFQQRFQLDFIPETHGIPGASASLVIGY